MELKTVPTATAKFLETMLKRIEHAENSRVLISLLEVAEKDLLRLSKIDTEVAGTARFNSLYVSSQLLFTRIIKNKLWCTPASPDQQKLGKKSIGKCLKNAIKLVNRI